MGGIGAVSGGSYGWAPVSGGGGLDEVADLGGGDDYGSEPEYSFGGDDYSGDTGEVSDFGLEASPELDMTPAFQGDDGFLDALVEDEEEAPAEVPDEAPQALVSQEESGSAQKASEAPQTYTVGRGETLGSVAKEVLGDANRWPELYEYNKDAIGNNPNKLKPGTELQIPPEGFGVDKGDRDALIRGAHIERPAQAEAPLAAPTARAAAAVDPAAATMAASKAGDAGAVTQNFQNIVDATRDRFTSDFTKQYQQENGGRSPSASTVNEAYYEQLMKGFTATRYDSFGKLSGVRPENLNPVFRDPKVQEMYNSFPNSFKPAQGGDPISVNHLLSGIQWQTTSADTVLDGIAKHTVGVGVNSNFAEDVVKSRASQERGHGGIWASKDPALQEAFKKDPVGALRDFLANPHGHIQAGKSEIHFNPLEGYQRLGHEIYDAIKN